MRNRFTSLDMPDIEAQLGQMEYSLGALREQLAIVRRTIDEYRKRGTTPIAAAAERVPTTSNAVVLDA